MASFVYNFGKVGLLKGRIDLVNDTIKCMLVTSSYTPDKDADEYRSDVTSEASGTGYSAGGKALMDNTVAQENPTDMAIFDAADTSWTVTTLTARAAVLYKETGAAATDILIAYLDFGSDYSTVGEDFTIEWDAAGILTLGE